MNFIKKIFENKIDEQVHNQFVKFGKGIFKHKALIDITITAKAVKIKTSPEYANGMVVFLANTIKDDTTKVQVNGIIFAAKDLSAESPIEFEEIKNAMGVKKHIVNKELTKHQILELHEKFPLNPLSLSFETEYGKLKIKEKAPKSGKPGKGDKKPKADYCVLITTDKSILEDYAFDIKEPFKKTFIEHTIGIDEIIVPEEYKNDFAKARIHAKRKGKITRFLTIDEKESEKETNFEV